MPKVPRVKFVGICIICNEKNYGSQDNIPSCWKKILQSDVKGNKKSTICCDCVGKDYNGTTERGDTYFIKKRLRVPSEARDMDNEEHRKKLVWDGYYTLIFWDIEILESGKEEIVYSPCC
jgi:hypothetical protein